MKGEEVREDDEILLDGWRLLGGNAYAHHVILAAFRRRITEET